MDNNLTKCHRFLCRAALWIAAVLTGVIFMLSVVVQSRVAMNSSEKVSFYLNTPLTLVGVAAFAALLWGFKSRIEKLDGRKLFKFCAAVYLAVGLLFILALGDKLRADANWVRWASFRFDEGDFSSLEKGEYLSRYPHQLGFLTYERILNFFSRNVKLCFCMNLLFVLMNNRTVWKISCLLFPDQPFTKNLTILLSFLFLPQFFFIAFAYGTIPGFAMLLLACLFQIKFLQTGRKRDGLLMVLFAGLSCILKSNSSIGVIALAVVLVLESIRQRKVKWLAAALALLLCMGAGPKAVSSYYEAKSGEPLIYAEPKILWVAMGLRDSSSRMVGWYDGFNKNTHKSVDYEPAQSKELAKASIRESLKRWRDTPGYGFNFFGKKIMSTWCDPLFQSLWSGPLEDCSQPLDDNRLGALYQEDSQSHIAVRQFCQVLLIFLYAMALTFLLRLLREKTCDVYLFGILFFVGGVLLHLVWETKSQYTYPYVFSLLPYLSNAFEFQAERLNRKYKSRFH